MDYTSEEFWKDAPDGATGHSEDNECYGECWYKNITSESFYCMPVSSGIWIHSFDTWQLERREVITRPKPQPIFTQAMADAGELPSVGMECMILFDQDSEPKWEKITWYGVFNGSPAFSFNGKNCWPERGGEFHLKPVGPTHR